MLSLLQALAVQGPIFAAPEYQLTSLKDEIENEFLIQLFKFWVDQTLKLVFID